MLAIASQVPTPSTHPVNEYLDPVSNELKNKVGIAGEDSFGVFAATRVLRVAVGGSEGEVRFQSGPACPQWEHLQYAWCRGARGYACPLRKPWSCLVVPRTNESFTMYDDRRRFSGNTAELAVRYVRNKASNYSPLTKGGYRGVLGRGDPAGLGRKITPPTPPSQGGDEFAISTTTVGYS